MNILIQKTLQTWSAIIWIVDSFCVAFFESFFLNYVTLIFLFSRVLVFDLLFLLNMSYDYCCTFRGSITIECRLPLTVTYTLWYGQVERARFVHVHFEDFVEFVHVSVFISQGNRRLWYFYVIIFKYSHVKPSWCW